MTYLEKHGVQLEVAPGEARNRLGVVERRHMVLRTALENYMDAESMDLTPENVKSVVQYVAPTLNTLVFT